ncbi:MAG: HAMP domain-containing histidine kinase [Actinobacteria bacterium]|nr:MAG: HAMP domain-containing histidine kinase [Actinomycetota bacterium]
MLRSLRFRLPALFLAGIVLSSLITAVIALRLFQSYTQQRLVAELRRDAVGLTQLYQAQADLQNGAPPKFAAPRLELATGARLYYIGLSTCPESKDGRPCGLRPLPISYLPNWQSDRRVTFEFTPPGTNRKYVAVANPLRLSGGRRHVQFGDLVVAKPKTELTRRLITLLDRLAIAFLGGIVIAGLLGWYLSRRITRPVLALSKAADEVSRGRYDVEVPRVRSGDEIGHLADRFREMAARLSEAEQQERNFLMTVSHELKTPLTAIRGHVDALREGLADDPELREASLDVIAAEGARLERLVGDVLDLAKLEAHRFTVLHEEVDMGRLCDLAYNAFGEEARRRGIDYRRSFDAAPTIVSDGDRVLQIISNLLTNAFRWTPDGGRVNLELAAENGTVSIAVDDTGPGISAAERERIFRPFWSRDDSGTGLGLAIARELAVALGGQIQLDSKPGAGSRFELLLPAQGTS